MAELTKCKTCGKEVSRTALTCPYCGESLPGLHIKCPKCGSMSIRFGQKGFDLGSAALGAILLGPLGLLGGVAGRKKTELICQACGYAWNPDLKDIT